MKNQTKFLKERTTLGTALISTLIGIVGIALLVCVEFSIFGKISQSFQSLLRDLGTLLVTSVAVSFLWGLWSRRAFLDELLPKVRLSEDMASAGITGFKSSFQNVEWDSLFRNVSELDILYLYGINWFRNHAEQILKGSKKQLKLRIVLADPNDDNTLSILARRYDRDPGQIKEDIEDTTKYLKKLHDKGVDISIWYLSAVPLYTFYRFDNTMVLSLYSHRPDERQGKGPTLLLEEEGTFYKFVLEEFDRIVSTNGPLSMHISF